MRIRHVINVVGPSARPDLLAEQSLALETIEVARRHLPDEIDVDVVGVRFDDEEQPAEWLVDRWPLQRSVLDLGEFRHPRRLPLLADVLRPFADGGYDLGVFTNVDIAVQPRFYELLADIRAQGHDAFVINRRTVQQPRPDGAGAVWLSHQVGAPHPGHDCFVFTPEVAADADVDDVCLGAPYVMRAFLYHLMLTADRFRDFPELHATFHVGDDRGWTGTQFDDYRDHNVAALRRSISRLVERHGHDAVAALPAARPHLRALAGEFVPERRWIQRFDRRPEPRSFDQRRLIFAASPGRCGSNYLATVLDSARNVHATHEPEPRMIGEHVRDIAFGSAAESFTRRQVKAAAIRDQLMRQPPNGVYAETSHMFVKTFADVVLEAFNHDRISIVHLHRPLPEIVTSMASLAWFTPVSRAWEDWLITPTAPGAMVRLDATRIESHLDLIIGYILDTEMRTRELRRSTPGVHWVDLDVATLAERAGLDACFADLRIEPTADTPKRTSRRVNLRAARKQEVGAQRDSDEILDRIASFRQRFASTIEAASLEDLFESTQLEASR